MIDRSLSLSHLHHSIHTYQRKIFHFASLSKPKCSPPTNFKFPVRCSVCAGLHFASPTFAFALLSHTLRFLFVFLLRMFYGSADRARSPHESLLHFIITALSSSLCCNRTLTISTRTISNCLAFFILFSKRQERIQVVQNNSQF